MLLGLALLLALHGAIHVLGFIKWSGLRDVPSPSAETLPPFDGGPRRLFAASWLVACAVMLGAAPLALREHGAWWMVAASGVLLSQVLIALAWKDAKFGTLANVLVLAAIAVVVAQTRFERRIDAEIRALFAAQPAASAAIVEPAELDGLPPPVRRWLEASGAVGRARVHSVRLRQRGALRTAPGAAWMPAESEQYFTVDAPAFVWRVSATMFGVLPAAGRDTYARGAGHMLVKAASLVNVANASDENIARGAMLRFLAEVMWFPSAALSSYIAWEPIDDTHARATMRDAGLLASAVFEFSDDGRVLGLQAMRPMGGGPDAKLTPWSGRCSEWRRVGGVEIPTRGEVSWTLETGSFSYYRWEIVDVEYDRPELYASIPRS